jgi:hypothetical protein
MPDDAPVPPPQDDVKQTAAWIAAVLTHGKRLGPAILAIGSFAWTEHQANVAFKADMTARVMVLEAAARSSDRLADQRWETTREQLERIQDGLYHLSSSMGEEIPGIVKVARLDREKLSATPSTDTASLPSTPSNP